MSADQLAYRPCGGAIAWNDTPQEVMPRNAARVGGYVANGSDHPIKVFMGTVVDLLPYRAVLVPEGYLGPVKVTGLYSDRYTACEFLKEGGTK